jgi:WD40 repeat protein
MMLWDIGTGKQIADLTDSSVLNPFSVAFSDDGAYVLSGGSGAITTIWDVASCKAIKTFKSPGMSSVRGAAFSQDGKWVISNQGNRVQLWDVKSCEMIRELSGFTATVRCLTFMPDGERALIGLTDGTVGFWNIHTGSEIARFIHFSDGEWVCLTKRGYFNASSGGAAHLIIRNPSGVSLMKGEYLSEHLWPEGTAAILSGKPLPTER